jgi:arginine deiminase
LTGARSADALVRTANGRIYFFAQILPDTQVEVMRSTDLVADTMAASAARRHWAVPAVLFAAGRPRVLRHAVHDPARIPGN